jgi:serine/threonine protein phosphatase PrpC
VLRSAEGVVVDCATLSDPGRDPSKQTNEDALAIAEMPFGVVAVVCDGMGGHEAGEVASRTAVQRIIETLTRGQQALDRLLSTALEQAHAEVYALGGDAPIDVRPGSTAVILALSGSEALLAHVGDSRAYRLRARSAERLTRDHSVVEALLRAGAISEEAARQHPDANRITRALGIAAEIEPEVQPPLRLELGDAFLLCSDGLSDLVEDAELAELVTDAATPEAACQALVALANQRGGHDNISVAILRILGLGRSRQARETHEMAAPVQPTVVAGPAFTVAMTHEPGAKTPSLGDDASRNTVPTLVDAMIAEQRQAARPAVRTEPELPAIPTQVPSSVPIPTTPHRAPLLFWVSLGLSALILVAIALWSALR